MDHLLANWKMYPSIDEASRVFGAIQAGLVTRLEAAATLPRVIVCPPFVSLVPLRTTADDRVVRLGAQTCHWEDSGPYTGETSPRMLRGLVDYVMVGHSDRRAAGESDDQIARKVSAVATNGLTPILFVGEDSPDDDAVAETERRLRLGLSAVDVVTDDVLVVYEPSWAIGADRVAPVDHIGRVVKHLKGALEALGRRDPKVLYGGSVTDTDIDDLVELEVLDGVGATRASLDPEVFLRIVDRVTGPG